MLTVNDIWKAIRTFTVFDAETAPLDDDTLRRLCPPFDRPPHPGGFDPAAVKVGNLGAAKAAEKIEAKRAEHAAAVLNYEADVAKGEAEHFEAFKGRAALDACTARVVCVGITVGKCSVIECDGDAQQESAGLTEFWRRVRYCLAKGLPMIGWNIHGFDLPFLVRRSWILGVPIPLGVRKGRYWNDLFIDLMQVWMLGGRDMCRLDTAAKACGIDGKVSILDGVEVSGSEFYKLWRDPERRKVAEAYLMADLRIPAQLAERMGVV